jgi:hypothetical protein
MERGVTTRRLKGRTRRDEARLPESRRRSVDHRERWYLVYKEASLESSVASAQNRGLGAGGDWLEDIGQNNVCVHVAFGAI